MNEVTTFFEKMVPYQKEGMKYYEGDNFLNDLYLKIISACNIPNPDDVFKLEYSNLYSQAHMGTPPLQLHFLQTLIYIARPKRILEIGTFVGVGTLYMAKALPKDGKICTIEKYDEFAKIAARNFKNNGFDSQIELLQGDAMEYLPKLSQSQFDFVYVDGNKEHYHDYINEFSKLLVPGGILLVDDILFNGDVLNPEPKTEKGLGALKAIQASECLENFHRFILPISNGLMLLIKTK